MPEKNMFAKRLGKKNFETLTEFFTGKKTFDSLPKDSQKVLNGLQ